MSERRSCRPLARSRPASRARARISVQLCGMKPPALATPTITVPAPSAAPCSGVISGRSRRARQPGSLICPMHQSRRHCNTPSAVLAASWSPASPTNNRYGRLNIDSPLLAGLALCDDRAMARRGEPSFTSIGASPLPLDCPASCQTSGASARAPLRKSCGCEFDFTSTCRRLSELPNVPHLCDCGATKLLKHSAALPLYR